MLDAKTGSERHNSTQSIESERFRGRHRRGVVRKMPILPLDRYVMHGHGQTATVTSVGRARVQVYMHVDCSRK